MKRNNIFMWAYITFIGISIALRVFIDYDIWNPIVLAITISSMFFAFEDLFHLLYQTQKKDCDITESFIADAKAKKESDLSFFSKLDEKAVEYGGTEYDLTEIQNKSNPAKKRMEEILHILKDLERLNNEERKKEKKLKIASHMFAFVGFLLLFISLIVCTLISVPLLVQEMLTVSSFAIILITQQINNRASEKIKNISERNNHILQDINEESEEWTVLKTNFNEVIKHIDKKLKSEGADNAD